MVTKLTAIVFLVATATVTATAAAGRTVVQSWKPSHGPAGGHACTLAVAPSAPTTIYVGTTGGVFRSVNGGGSWERAGRFARQTDPFPGPEGCLQAGVTSVLVDPRTPTTLYAGLNEVYQGDTSLQPVFKSPVFKSTNGGRTWHALALRGEPIAISSTSPATVYAAAGGPDGTSRLLRSTDGGRDWRPADSGLPSTYVDSLAFDPEAPSTSYAAMGTNGVFESSDGGGSWRSVGSAQPEGGGVTAIAVDPRRPQTVYAATDAGLLKSLNDGGSWHKVNTTIGSHNRDRAYGRVSALVVDPRNSNTVYAATALTGILKSTDGGRRWRRANAGLPQSPWTASLALDPQAPQTLYAADPRQGVFKSLDGGAHWGAINDGLSLSTIRSLAVASRPGTVYAAAGDLGLFKTSDGGTHWRSLASGPRLVDDVAVDPSNPRTVLAVAPGGGVLRSSDGGDAWTGVALGAGGGSTHIVAISGKTAYAGGLRLYRSMDGAHTWSEVRGLEGHGPGVVQALAIAPANPAVVYAGIAGIGTSTAGGLYRSTDSGRNWKRLTTADADAIALDPTNPATLYVAGNGAYKSTNGGATWQPISSGLPAQAFVTTLAIDTAHPTTLYAAYDQHGVFRTSDSGRTWQPINAGLSGLDVRTLAVDATGRTVYAGTTGGGVVSLQTGR